MRKLLGCLLVLPGLALAQAAPTSATGSGPLAGLDFLVGDWHTVLPGSERGDRFAYELDRKVMTRTVPGSGPGAAPHSIMTLWPDADGKTLRAIYFDDQGHVIHYRSQSLEAGKRVQLLSDGTDPGPTFRLTYERDGAKLHATFEMSPPGQADVFRVLAEGDEVAAH